MNRRKSLLIGYLIFNLMALVLAFVVMGISPMLHIQLSLKMALLLANALLGHIWFAMLIAYGGGKAGKVHASG